jgi:hypothetical protein
MNNSIDEDILNLMDEVDLDEFLREASDAIDDPEKLTQFIREKATVAIERFLVSNVSYYSRVTCGFLLTINYRSHLIELPSEVVNPC